MQIIGKHVHRLTRHFLAEVVTHTRCRLFNLPEVVAQDEQTAFVGGVDHDTMVVEAIAAIDVVTEVLTNGRQGNRPSLTTIV